MKFLAFCCVLFFVSSAGAAQWDSPTQDPIKTLKNANFFSMEGVGYGNQSSDGEKALRILAKSEDASAIFAEILGAIDCSKAGQLYALIGLRWTNEAEFQKRITPYLKD